MTIKESKNVPNLTIAIVGSAQTMENWNYKDKDVLFLMLKHLSNTDFMGIKGQIKFDDNGDIFGDVQFEQLIGNPDLF